jgi:AcrR family transcriptional regulator
LTAPAALSSAPAPSQYGIQRSPRAPSSSEHREQKLKKAKPADGALNSEEPVGLRERSKREKLRRIKEAARAVFRKKGYEAATTREIAARAEVAYGTLFVYARDKRDLLMMIVNDDLDALSESALEKASTKGPLIDQVVEFFRSRFEYWASEPQFARHAVREMFEFLTHGEDPGIETARFRARRSQVVEKLAELVRRKQDAGSIARDEDPEMIAWLFQAIYLSENRQWLESHKPDLGRVISRLRHLLRLAMRGIGSDPREWGEAASGKRTKRVAN